MARIDRKIKRELARAQKARSIREKKLESAAYDLGVQMGIQFQKQKVNYSTLGMGYLYEYPVVQADDSVCSTGVQPVLGVSVDPRYDYPDGDAIPA